jgi:integrase
MLVCPECGSKKTWKDGLRYVQGNTIQRYLCRSCGYRFSETSLKVSKDPECTQSVYRMALNMPSSLLSNRQICVLDEKAKNLVAVENMEKKTAGDTSKTADIKSELINFAWWMKKNGYAESTIRVWTNTLKILKKLGANLSDPESVKDVITKAICQKLNKGKPWSQSRKHIAIACYTLFLRMHGKKWDPPRCKVTRKLPFIPTEQELDSLISGCGKKTATFFQLLKETGMRAGEATSLFWIDFDLQKRILVLNNPEKNGTPRAFNLSLELTQMLSALQKKNDKLFANVTMSSLKSSFSQSRKKLSSKLQNPRLKRISFHTFRHWKATTLYHETKDPLYVKEFLGHKKLDTTLLYIQIEKTLYKNQIDNFTVKVAKNEQDITDLLSIGFEYICEKDGLVFFRKRK